MVIDVSCPACWQPTSVDVAAWDGEVEQWEDCQVCCRPMRLVVTIRSGELMAVKVDADG